MVIWRQNAWHRIRDTSSLSPAAIDVTRAGDGQMLGCQDGVLPGGEGGVSSMPGLGGTQPGHRLKPSPQEGRGNKTSVDVGPASGGPWRWSRRGVALPDDVESQGKGRESPTKKGLSFGSEAAPLSAMKLAPFQAVPSVTTRTCVPPIP